MSEFRKKRKFGEINVYLSQLESEQEVKSRKRKAFPDIWRKNKAKLLRNSVYILLYMSFMQKF